MKVGPVNTKESDEVELLRTTIKSHWQWQSWVAANKCDKVFKNGPRKICGRQPLKKFIWSILEYFVPYFRAVNIENSIENLRSAQIPYFKTIQKVTHNKQGQIIS